MTRSAPREPMLSHESQPHADSRPVVCAGVGAVATAAGRASACGVAIGDG